MGRPLNKKYFGNRNTGSASTTADDDIGGTRVESVTLNALGSYTTRPVATFSDPDLLGAGGVRATGTVTSEVLSVSIGGSQTRAYPVTAGAISFVGGTTTATFTATVTSSALASVAYASATTISFNTTTTAMISGTSIHITGASITGNMTIGGTTIAAGQIYYVGAPTTATAATLYATYDNAVNATSPLTISNGTTTGATFTRGVTYGTVTALTPVNRGAFEALVTGAQNAVCDTYGAALTITPTYRAKAVVITEKGSGYSHAADASVSFTQSVTASAVTMITDTGVVGSADSQENAITAYAYHTGGSLLIGDITRQVSTNRYKVKNATATAIAKLKSTIANAAGEMNIVATDASGGTYYVTKLTAHRATLVPAAVARLSTSAGTTYSSGQSARWSFAAASGAVVQIENT
jgi:hypothetical protein